MSISNFKCPSLFFFTTFKNVSNDDHRGVVYSIAYMYVVYNIQGSPVL